MLVDVNMGKHVDPAPTAILATVRDSLRPKGFLKDYFVSFSILWMPGTAQKWACYANGKPY